MAEKSELFLSHTHFAPLRKVWFATRQRPTREGFNRVSPSGNMLNEFHDFYSPSPTALSVAELSREGEFPCILSERGRQRGWRRGITILREVPWPGHWRRDYVIQKWDFPSSFFLFPSRLVRRFSYFPRFLDVELTAPVFWFLPDARLVLIIVAADAVEPVKLPVDFEIFLGILRFIEGKFGEIVCMIYRCLMCVYFGLYRCDLCSLFCVFTKLKPFRFFKEILQLN